MENKKETKTNFSMRHSLVTLVILIASLSVWALVSNFFFVAVQRRIYWGNCGIYVFLSIFCFVACFITSLRRDDLDYKFSENEKILKILNLGFGTLGAFIIVFAVIASFVNSSVGTAKSRYDFVAKTVTTVDETDEISAFPNLLGNNNDTSNLPLIGVPEAIKLCETEMGKVASLSSQFEIKKSEVTSQNINGELCYVIPLEPISMFKWDKSIGSYGYFIVDRNTKNVELVNSPLFTTEYAPFGSAAARVIYSFMDDNHISGVITDISPEVDDNGVFHYIATVYQKKLGGMKSVTGVVDLDATTKSCTFYAVNDIPEFVDRVYPEQFFEDYMYYYGAYLHGFMNSFVSQKDVRVLTEDYDVIYIDGVCYYYSGLQSVKNKNSSSAIVMMNSRTGEITIYNTSGISERRARDVAQGKVQEKEYVASYPLLLEVGGEETYFMLMRDKTENLVGYSFVNYHDASFVSVNENLMLAQSEYIKSCSSSNSSNSLENKELTNKKGVISAITSEVLDGTTIYYVKFNGSNQIFSLHSVQYPEIVFTQVGDELSINFVSLENTAVIPIVDVL